MEQRKERRLHNFELPNDGLKWGAHKQLRFVKIHSGSPISHGFHAPATPENDRSPHVRQELTNNNQLVSPPARDSGHQINESAPGNQLLDIQAAAERMKIPLVKDTGKGIVKEIDVKKKSVATKSWNLRTRGASCGSPQVNGGMSATSGGSSGGGGGAIPKILVPMAKEVTEEDSC